MLTKMLVDVSNVDCLRIIMLIYVLSIGDMMKKELLMGNPIVKCYPNYAGVFSIIDAYTKDYVPWVYNYFLQLAVPIQHTGLRIDFDVPNVIESLPWLSVYKINRKMINDKWGGMTNFLIDAVDQDMYPYLLFDKYYDLNTNKSDIHYLHERMVYGYDTEYKVFLYADNNKSGKYGFDYSSFECMELSDNQVQSNLFDWFEGVYLLKYRQCYSYGMYEFKDYYKHSFDIKLLICLLNDYLTEYPSLTRWQYPSNFYNQEEQASLQFGIGVYDYILKYLDFCKKSDTALQIRGSYVLYEHKKLIVDIINYLMIDHGIHCNEHIILWGKESLEISKIILNLFIKYNISRKKKIIDDIQTYMVKLKEHDGKVFSGIIKACQYQLDNYDNK